MHFQSINRSHVVNGSFETFRRAITDVKDLAHQRKDVKGSVENQEPFDRANANYTRLEEEKAPTAQKTHRSGSFDGE